MSPKKKMDEIRELEGRIRVNKTLTPRRTPLRKSLIADCSVLQNPDDLKRRNKLVKERIYLLQYEKQLTKDKNSTLQEKVARLEEELRISNEENWKTKSESLQKIEALEEKIEALEEDNVKVQFGFSKISKNFLDFPFFVLLNYGPLSSYRT